MTLTLRYRLQYRYTGGVFVKTVKEVSGLTGISVRTLHHYDAIGLLKPTRVTQAGYRMYDDEALCRLQTILLFRELEFPLKEIGEILDSPGFDQKKALEQQIRLLELRRDHISNLITHARQIQREGRINRMDFSAFDKSKMNEYAAQAKAEWGKTEAYKEFEEKTAGQTQEQLVSTGNALMDIFKEFGEIRHSAPESREAQVLVEKLQSFITRNYYTCTVQILQGLGQMYVAGGSMTENIDSVGGEGTAEFSSKAIEFFCKTM